MVLTVLLLVAGGLVSLLLMEEVFTVEGSSGRLLVAFLGSVRVPLSVVAAVLAVLNAVSWFWRDGGVPWNDYPFLPWVVTLVNALLAGRVFWTRLLRLEGTAVGVWLEGLEARRKVFGAVGLLVCSLKALLMAEPLLRWVF